MSKKLNKQNLYNIHSTKSIILLVKYAKEKLFLTINSEATLILKKLGLRIFD